MNVSSFLLGLDLGMSIGKVIIEVVREVRAEIERDKSKCQRCPHK